MKTYYTTHIDPHKDLPLFLKVVSSSLYADYYPLIKELFAKSIEAHSGNYSVFDLQKELLTAILNVNHIRKEYLRRKELYGRGLNKLVNKGAPQERIRYVKSGLDRMQDYAEAAIWVIRQFRAIGDSIAWRFLGYDRLTLRLLAEHDYVQVPELDRGLRSEMSVIEDLNAQGHALILNTISNFLRVGDIILFDKKSNTYRIMEVKTSLKRTYKIRKQSKYRDLIQECLDMGLFEIKGVRIIKQVSDKPLITYIRSVESALIEADQKLVSSRLFGDYLSVGVFASTKIVKECPEDKMVQLQDRVFDRCYSVRRKKEDILLPPMSNIFSMASFIPNFAPYAIFPMKPEWRFKLLTGEFFIISILNISGLARWLIKRGWQVELIQPKDRTSMVDDEFKFNPIMKVNNIQLSLDMLPIAAAEFWRPESIEMQIGQASRSRTTGGKFHVVSFPNIGKCAWD